MKWSQTIVAKSVIGVGMLLVVACVLLGTGVSDALTQTNMEQLALYLRSFGMYAVVVGMLIILLQTAIPLAPFMIFAGANTVVFGFWWGFLINYSMSCLGGFLLFLFARHIGRDWVTKKLANYPRMVHYRRLVEKRGFFYIMLGRLLPIVPSFLVNVGAGVTRIPTKTFLLATLLGKLPMIFIESLAGFDLLQMGENRLRLIIVMLLLVAMIGAGGWFKWRFDRNQMIPTGKE